MQIFRTADYLEASKKAASIIASQIILKPNAILGLATGSTPIKTYELLVRMYEAGELDFSQISTINLDEYRGLEATHKQSYRYFMNQHLFDHVNIDKANTYLPDGMEPDSTKACKEYEAIIKNSAGIDLQVLGLGHNGHIGFNEPSDSFSIGTHCVDLTASTIEANKRFFNCIEEVPKQAYTMGIASILSAKKILLLVSGEDKAAILAKAIKGKVTPEVPASILQLHQDVVVVADEKALLGM